MNGTRPGKQLLLWLPFILAACASSPKALNPVDLIAKGMECFGEQTVTVYTVPSHGAIGDRMSIAAAKSTGNDGGFSEGFRKLVDGGSRRFVFYSANSEKMSVLLRLALAKFNDNALKGVGICYVGEKKYAKVIADAVRRTGADFYYAGM